MRPVLPVLLTATVLLTTSCTGSGGHRLVAAPTATPTATLASPASRTTTPSPRPRVTTPAPRPTAAAPTPSLSPRPSPVPSRSAAQRYAFPVQGCSVSYAHSHHDYPATDILAARGCRVVSPVTGVVDEVSSVDRWNPSTDDGATRGGLSFSVVGVDGVRYYGSHLTTVVVHPGQHVRAGQTVGTVGSTGDARGTATHLHFGLSWPTRHGIWWVRRGELYPWPYLDSWRAGGSRSPAAAVATLHRQLGDVPPCRVEC